MKIRIKATSVGSYDKVIDRYPCLKDFNYTEILYPNECSRPIIDSYIDIESLDDLISLINAVDQDIVLFRKPEWDPSCKSDYYVEIYDDWRE